VKKKKHYCLYFLAMIKTVLSVLFLSLFFLFFGKQKSVFVSGIHIKNRFRRRRICGEISMDNHHWNGNIKNNKTNICVWFWMDKQKPPSKAKQTTHTTNVILMMIELWIMDANI
jgi:hypothetical protein